jgi:hypothetical protein
MVLSDSLEVTFTAVDALYYEREFTHWKKMGLNDEDAAESARLRTSLNSAPEEVLGKIWNEIGKIHDKYGSNITPEQL